MKLHQTVVFTELGAKVLSGKPYPFHSKKNVLVDPEIGHLKDVPTIFWKLEGLTIVEMDRLEKLKRLKDLKTGIVPKSPLQVLYPQIGSTFLVLVAGIVFFFKNEFPKIFQRVLGK